MNQSQLTSAKKWHYGSTTLTFFGFALILVGTILKIMWQDFRTFETVKVPPIISTILISIGGGVFTIGVILWCKNIRKRRVTENQAGPIPTDHPPPYPIAGQQGPLLYGAQVPMYTVGHHQPSENYGQSRFPANSGVSANAGQPYPDDAGYLQNPPPYPRTPPPPYSETHK